MSGDPIRSSVQPSARLSLGELQPFQQLLDTIAAAMYICDAQGHVTACNEAAISLWGKRPELGKDLWYTPWRLFRLNGEELPPDESPMGIVLKGGTTADEPELIVQRADGTRRRVRPHSDPTRDSSGRIIGAVNLLLDVTAQREGERAQALLAAIVQSSDDAIISKTLDGYVTSWNAAAERIFGYTAEEMIGKSITTLIPHERLSEEDDILRRLRRGERIEHFETIRRSKDGRLISISLTVSPVRDRTGRLVGASKIARDVTAQKRAEEALRRSEKKFLLMADAAPVMVWISGTDKRFTWFNKQWLDFVGRTMERELGTGWMENIHRDDLARYMQIYNSAFDIGVPFAVEYRLKRRDGEYRWMLDHGVPLHGTQGEFAGYIGSCVDVTEQVLARHALERQQALLAEAVRERTRELEHSHQRLRMAERMASLGTLSAGLGHDMGNLLVPVRVSVDLLAAGDLPADLRGEVERIRTSAHYLQQLASGLRMMAMDPEKTGPPEALHIKTWWDEAKTIVKNALPRGVTFESELVDDAWVNIPRPALTQAVFNLVQNAGEALRGRPNARVRVIIARDADHVVLSIEDNGPGMTDEVRDRCMDPFYTTKTRGISTGLGLVLVSGIVRDAGGTVEIDTAIGRGTTFRLRLPVGREASADGSTAQRGQALVDLRDARMRSIVSSELRHMGFDVIDDDARAVDIAVIDGAAQSAGKAASVRNIVLFGELAPDATTENIRAIGIRPKLEDIRQALRAARDNASTGTPAS